MFLLPHYWFMVRSSDLSPTPHQLDTNRDSISQISSNTMRLAELEETAGTMWSLLIQNSWTGRAVKFMLAYTFLSHRFSPVGLKWDNWNVNIVMVFSSLIGTLIVQTQNTNLCFHYCQKHVHMLKWCLLRIKYYGIHQIPTHCDFVQISQFFDVKEMRSRKNTF